MDGTMRQAVMTGPRQIQFREVPIPEVGAEDVLVKIMRVGVCGSDVHVFKGKHPYTTYPVVQGHEVSGLVVETGQRVADFSPGDRVTIEPQVSCGACYPCTHGMYNVCDRLKVLGFQSTGTASDYFAVPARKLVKVPASVDYDCAAMIEPLSVAVRAVAKAGDMQRRRAVVLGAGPIGNLVAQTAKAQGASEVMAVDVNEFRLEKAQHCGIDHVVNPKRQDVADAVAEIYGRDQKADVIFECAGAVATMDMAVSLARKGSTVLVVGVFGERVPVDMATVNENELSILGTARYVIEDFERAIQLLSAGKVTLTPLITHHVDFPEYAEAYRVIEERSETAMKVMVRVNEE